MSQSQESLITSTFTNAIVILDCDVIRNSEISDGWFEGPLLESANILGNHLTADVSKRSTFFSPNIIPVLYGTSSSSSSINLRSHKEFEDTPVFSGLSVRALELLKVLPTISGINNDFQMAQLIVHLQVPQKPWEELLSDLHHIIRARTGRQKFFEFLQKLLPSDIFLPGNLKDQGQTFNTAADTRMFSILKNDSDVVPGSNPQEMLELATLTPSSINPPGPRAIENSLAETIYPSEDWAFLVRRDGVGIQSRLNSTFSTELDFYFRTIYTDLFTLARIQTRVVNEMSARLVDIALNPNFSSEDIQNFDREVAIFRAAYNWTSVSPSHVANDLLSAYQSQFGVLNQFKDLSLDLTSLANAAALQAANSAERASRQTSGTLSALTVFGVPLSLAMSLWQSNNGGLLEFFIAIISAASISTIALLLLPGLRKVIRDMRGVDSMPRKISSKKK